MSQQSEMADDLYERTGREPVAAADLVCELRTRWGPEHGVGSVHRFVEEVAACLLHHHDVEVGAMKADHFTPLPLEPWDAHKKIADELMSMETFFEDRTRYVFRRTPKT
jgi:hypothetical protein